MEEERFLGTVKAASSPAPVPSPDTPARTPNSDIGPIPGRRHASEIGRRAFFRAQNLEPKLLGKLRSVSEFPHSKSRRKLSRQRGEIRPSRGGPDLAVLRALVSVPPGHADGRPEARGCGLRLWDKGRRPQKPGTYLGQLASHIWAFLVHRYSSESPPRRRERAGYGQLAACRHAVPPQIRGLGLEAGDRHPRSLCFSLSATVFQCAMLLGDIH